MKDMNDIQARIKAELEQWFPKQIRNEFDDYYLYYLPTTPEHDGGFVITKEKPFNPEYCLATKVEKHLTIEQNHRKLAEVCRSLPILEY